jgi:hypothetical protein
MLRHLGGLSQDRGDLAGATAHCLQGLGIARSLGDYLLSCSCLEGVAVLSWLQGRPERAARLFGALQAARRTSGQAVISYWPDDYEGWVAATRDALGDEASTALEAGEAMSLDEAVAEALRDGPPGTQ